MGLCPLCWGANHLADALADAAGVMAAAPDAAAKKVEALRLRTRLVQSRLLEVAKATRSSTGPRRAEQAGIKVKKAKLSELLGKVKGELYA